MPSSRDIRVLVSRHKTHTIGIVLVGAAAAMYLTSTSIISGMQTCVEYSWMDYRPDAIGTVVCDYKQNVLQEITFISRVFSGTDSSYPVEGAPANVRILHPNGNTIYQEDFVSEVRFTFYPDTFGEYKAIITVPSDLPVNTNGVEIGYRLGFFGLATDLIQAVGFLSYLIAPAGVIIMFCATRQAGLKKQG